MDIMRPQLLVLMWATCVAFPLVAAEPFDWQTATPESQGMSSAKLDSLKEGLAAKTASLLIIRNDRIVYEWYKEGRSASDPHYTASLAKALVGGLSLAVAIDDGRMSLDDPVWRFVPEWKDHAQKSKITIRQLGSHTSGLEDSSVTNVEHTKEPGWKGVFWQRQPPPNDPFTVSRDQTPVLFEPGTKAQYSNPGIAMLTYAVTAAIQDGRDKDIRMLLRERVMRPIGVPDKEWSVGYGQTVSVNGLPLIGSWGGGAFTPRTAARVGRLVLRSGDWDGTRVLSAEALQDVTSDAGLPGHCGMGWWTNAGGRYAGLPHDAVWGAGAGDQLLLLVPSQQLILVRNGAALAERPDGDAFAEKNDARAKLLFEPIMATITATKPAMSQTRPELRSAPYPPSEALTGIEWAPAESIIRQARGSDNWPLTWGDDDALYGAYGDGNGFVPFTEKKLSLGLARIFGEPPGIQGVNVRSSTAEQQGDGAHGRKAGGLLMVNGVLYMLVRNVANSQLGWSNDHGQTWAWAEWKFTTSFGCPTFLNFGPNYSGARDNFVYIASPDTDSAYTPGDRMVLARVSKNRLTDHSAYEFFAGLDATGSPKWTSDVADRGAVFEHPGRCYRTGMTYNAAFQRYLWCQVLPESRDSRGPRFQGGFGIYDAPEPWGPWTTVFFTNDWDVGPGDTSSFPTKWMSADGRRLHLVFSGDDAFSVRRAVLKVAE
jgi:CubicO group peptidase (beta-lactamase class C family)